MSSDINYIIRQSINGDKIYQEILLQKLNPLIYRNIYRYWNASEPVIEDLAQEGYIVVLESLKTYNEGRNVHFLYYIKTRLTYFYKNCYRKMKTQQNKISFLENNMDSNFMPGKTAESSLNTLDSVIAGEEISELLSNIKKLPKKDKKILYLYYYKQLTMTQVSENLNIPYSTAMGRKQAALKKLRKLMAARS